MLRKAVLSMIAIAFAGPAFTSSGDAWQEFATDVRSKCLAATKQDIGNARVAVDPFGSERFGLAIVSGTATGTKTPVSRICIYDKRTRAVETGSELGRDIVKIEVPKAGK